MIDLRWLTEVGLAFDTAGALIMAYDLIIPRKKAIDLSLPRYPYDTDEENLRLPAVKD